MTGVKIFRKSGNLFKMNIRTVLLFLLSLANEMTALFKMA